MLVHCKVKVKVKVFGVPPPPPWYTRKTNCVVRLDFTKPFWACIVFFYNRYPGILVMMMR